MIFIRGGRKNLPAASGDDKQANRIRSNLSGDVKLSVATLEQNALPVTGNDLSVAAIGRQAGRK
jgi:hypothetical protein